MTPLEELQAAHKRLSELKNRTSYGSWVNHSGEVVTSDHFLVATFGDADEADLTVTMHRTIDAQLMLLENAIVDSLLSGMGVEEREAAEAELWELPDMMQHLARAINGEAS